MNQSAAWRNCSANADFLKSPRRIISDLSSGGCGRTFFSHFRGGSSANPPRIRPGPRRTASEQIYSAKKFFWRIPRRRQLDPIGPTRTQADSIGVCRGIVPPPRLPSKECRNSLDGRFEEDGFLEVEYVFHSSLPI